MVGGNGGVNVFRFWTDIRHNDFSSREGEGELTLQHLTQEERLRPAGGESYSYAANNNISFEALLGVLLIAS